VSGVENLFIEELTAYFAERGRRVSSRVIRVLSLPPVDLTPEERETYYQLVAPARELVKYALRQRLGNDRARREEWASAFQVHSNTVIGGIAAEVLLEMDPCVGRAREVPDMDEGLREEQEGAEGDMAAEPEGVEAGAAEGEEVSAAGGAPAGDAQDEVPVAWEAGKLQGEGDVARLGEAVEVTDEGAGEVAREGPEGVEALEEIGELRTGELRAEDQAPEEEEEAKESEGLPRGDDETAETEEATSLSLAVKAGEGAGREERAGGEDTTRDTGEKTGEEAGEPRGEETAPGTSSETGVSSEGHPSEEEGDTTSGAGVAGAGSRRADSVAARRSVGRASAKAAGKKDFGEERGGGRRKPSWKLAMRVLEWTLTLVFVLVILFAAFLMLAPRLGLQTHSVLSGSMEPALKAGGVVFCRSVPVDDVKVGDIIGFVDPEGNEVTHRVINIEDRKGKRWFQTKGDANEEPDPNLITISGGYVDKVVYHIPYLGFLSDFMHTRAGFLVFICIPALILLVLFGRDLWSGVGEMRKKRGGGADGEEGKEKPEGVKEEAMEKGKEGPEEDRREGDTGEGEGGAEEEAGEGSEVGEAAVGKGEGGTGDG